MRYCAGLTELCGSAPAHPVRRPVSLNFGVAELWVVINGGMFLKVFVVNNNNNNCEGCAAGVTTSCTHHRTNDIFVRCSQGL